MAHPQLPLLSAHDLGLTLPSGRRLFAGLSFSLHDGRTALVGANGVGKSLLLDVLAGVRPPSAGRVLRAGGVAYVRQGRALRSRHRGETVADRLGVAGRLAALERALAGSADPADLDVVGADGWDLPERLTAELARVGLGGLGLGRAMTTLSGGEAARVTLLGALLARPDVVLLDEPTNDLDATSRAAFLDMLGRWPGAVLLVSHDRAVLRTVDETLELEAGGLTRYGGGWDVYRAVRDERDRAAAEALASARAARRKARADARDTVERQARRAARGRRSRSEGGVPKILLNARKGQAEATTARLGRAGEDAVAAAQARVAAAAERVDESAGLRMDTARSGLPAGKEVVRLEGAVVVPAGSSVPALDGVDLSIRGPERVAVRGPNGSGKTTLLRLCVGEIEAEAGAVRRHMDAADVAYLPQRLEVPGTGDTVLDRFRSLHPRMDEGQARHVLARYLFPGDAARTPVGRLSGGERVRAALGCILGGHAAPPFLVLDEPTNHLDLPSLDVVERALAEYDGALLVVSHDADFLEAVGVERYVDLG